MSSVHSMNFINWVPLCHTFFIFFLCSFHFFEFRLFFSFYCVSAIRTNDIIYQSTWYLICNRLCNARILCPYSNSIPIEIRLKNRCCWLIFHFYKIRMKAKKKSFMLTLTVSSFLYTFNCIHKQHPKRTLKWLESKHWRWGVFFPPYISNLNYNMLSSDKLAVLDIISLSKIYFSSSKI